MLCSHLDNAYSILILIVIVYCMGKKFKHWLTLNLAKTRQTSAAFDGRVGVDNTKGVGAAIRVNTSSPSAKNIRISKSSEIKQTTCGNGTVGER